MDKVLIVLNATSSGVCIISFARVVGVPAGIASASLTLISSLTTEIMKKLSSLTRNKKKNQDKILMLAKSKLDIIETLVVTKNLMRLLGRKKYERTKENVKNVSEKQENVRLNSVNSKEITSL